MEDGDVSNAQMEIINNYREIAEEYLELYNEARSSFQVHSVGNMDGTQNP